MVRYTGRSDLRVGRRIVLVDIENAARGAVTSEETVRWVQRAVGEAVGVTAKDPVVIGVSHIGLLAVGCGWPGQRYVVQSGVNGADLALLDVLAENMAERFDSVVLVSGDGIFADAVAALGAEGVSVTVVADRDSLSRRLQMAAADVLFLDEHPSAVSMTQLAA